MAGKLHGMAVVTRLAEAEVKDLHDYFGGGLTARPVDRVVLCAESHGASPLPPYADGDQCLKKGLICVQTSAQTRRRTPAQTRRPTPAQTRRPASLRWFFLLLLGGSSFSTLDVMVGLAGRKGPSGCGMWQSRQLWSCLQGGEPPPSKWQQCLPKGACRNVLTSVLQHRRVVVFEGEVAAVVLFDGVVLQTGSDQKSAPTCVVTSHGDARLAACSVSSSVTAASTCRG